MTPDEIARIGQGLYAGASYAGKPAWQSRLAGGLGVLPRTVRKWVSGDAEIPERRAATLRRADLLADRLAMASHPGTLIEDRIAELAARGGAENAHVLRERRGGADAVGRLDEAEGECP